MQVAAYTSGHRKLAGHHCLLLRHVLWQRPEEADRIYDWLLEALAADDGMQQMQYLLAGMFGRACRSLNEPESSSTVVEEVAQLRETLSDKLAEVYASTLGGMLSVSEGLWLGEEEAAAVASALLPRMEKTRDEVEKLLFEVVTLEVSFFRPPFFSCNIGDARGEGVFGGLVHKKIKNTHRLEY